jgi:nucleotide-binding universal stress UspA family protein
MKFLPVLRAGLVRKESTMFHKVLVPLDGSVLAEHALPPALSLVDRKGGEVLLLRVAVAENTVLVEAAGGGNAHGVAWPAQSLEAVVQEARNYLSTLQIAYGSPGQIVRMKVLTEERQSQDIAALIVEVARDEGSDLIVMSSHGRTGFTRWVLGSVAERVLSAAPCPVLVRRSPAPVRRVLIPLDGSPLSECAVQPGLEVAAGLGAQVTLLRAITEAGSLGGNAEHQFYRQSVIRRLLVAAPSSQPVHHVLDQLSAEADFYLRRVAAVHQRPGQTIHTAVEAGPAAESILRFAEQHAVDLIAMATHGRTGLQRWVYGSVTDRVVHGGQRSMLVVRPAAPIAS